MKISLLYCSIIVFLVTSCTKENRQTNVLPDSIFVKFYADSLVVSEDVKVGKMDSNHLKQKMDSLYKEYNLTSEQTATTLRYHQDNIERWRDFYAKVVKRLELLQQNELHK
jgi:hypothetical protein